MELNWKKIGIIVLFILAVVLFAFFLYYFFFRTLFTPTATNTNATNANGQLPVTVNINGKIYVVNGNGQLPGAGNLNTETPGGGAIVEPPTTSETTAITKNPAYYGTTSANGDLLYYDPQTGKFYRLSVDGRVTELSDKVFYNVSNVTWSNNRDKAILEYPDGSNIVYDFNTEKQMTLPAHWEDFSFSPNDQQITFKSVALDLENRFLAVSNYDGSQTKILERIGGVENQFNASWSPNNQMVATFTEGKDASRSNVYFVGLNNENFKLMVVEGRGFEGQWSPNGQLMLYSVYDPNNDYKPELWISQATPNNIGDNRQKLELNTWSDKCAFSRNDKIYCAVPNELPFGVGLDRTQSKNSSDTIYEIDLKTGSKKVIADPEGFHSIGQIIVVPNSSYLYFSDSNNNKIYKVKI